MRRIPYTRLTLGIAWAHPGYLLLEYFGLFGLLAVGFFVLGAVALALLKML